MRLRKILLPNQNRFMEVTEMEIRKYKIYREEEILPLYAAVGWTAYTDQPSVLAQGFAQSLLTLGAYEEGKLIGLVRTVGDGCTVVLVQDLLVFPSHQRQGVGSTLLREILNRFSQVRPIQLATDNTPKTLAFYKSLGFWEMSELDCRGFMRIKV